MEQSGTPIRDEIPFVSDIEVVATHLPVLEEDHERNYVMDTQQSTSPVISATSYTTQDSQALSTEFQLPQLVPSKKRGKKNHKKDRKERRHKKKKIDGVSSVDQSHPGNIDWISACEKKILEEQNSHQNNSEMKSGYELLTEEGSKKLSVSLNELINNTLLPFDIPHEISANACSETAIDINPPNHYACSETAIDINPPNHSVSESDQHTLSQIMVRDESSPATPPGIRNASAHTTTPQQKKNLLTEGQILPSNQPETTKKRKNKPREVYDTVSVVYDVKETENGNVLNISIKAPKTINYAILNIHKESSCICVIKDVYPLGTTQFKRNHDCNWNANKVSKQCHIAMNLLKQDEI